MPTPPPAPSPKNDVGEDGQPRTQFDYLLNAADRAGDEEFPHEHDYRAKRLALFKYVRELEAR